MTYYPFAPEFEQSVVALLVSSDRFFGLVGVHLDPAMLSNPSAQLLAAAARDLYEQIGKAPGSDAVVLQRLRTQHEQGKLTAAKLGACADYLCDAFDRGLPEVDVAAHEVASVLKRIGQQRVLDKAFTTFAERGDLTQVARDLVRVETIGKVDASLGVGLDDFAAELDLLGRVDRLPTGFRELDVEMDGGPERGEFCFWLAGTKVGKSMALVQNAAIGMFRGLHVAVATLELDVIKWRARVLGTVTGTPYADIMKFGSKSVAFERYNDLRAETNLGRLSVHKFGGHQTGLPEILDWVAREEERHKQPVDLLVIDYADKITGRDLRDSEYTQMRDVYEGIRLWAHDNRRWAWSASQARRIALGELPTMNDCADSQHKVRVVDMVVAITRVPDDENKVRAKVVAKRNGSGDGAEAGPVPNGFDFGCFALNAVQPSADVVERALVDGDAEQDQEGSLGIFG